MQACLSQYLGLLLYFISLLVVILCSGSYFVLFDFLCIGSGKATWRCQETPVVCWKGEPDVKSCTSETIRDLTNQVRFFDRFVSYAILMSTVNVLKFQTLYSILFLA